ncbi:MAG: aminopeptidase [Candidatus Bathyarchaeota archaeon]|nr:MAG: aminopeptidase [Candidatus Bathyarchaeota archaeon]
MVKPHSRVSIELSKAANIAVNEVLGIKKGERVLLITNPAKDVYHISQALYSASHKAKASPTLMIQPKKLTFNFAEPAIINAIKSEPEVVISISAERMGKDKDGLANPYKGLDGKIYTHIFSQLLRGVKRIRAFWSPSVTIDMFTRTVPIDYSVLQKTTADLAKAMNNAASVGVKTTLGTDITFGVKGRRARTDDGDFKAPGKGGNLPCGEVFASPALGTASGTIVFDGSLTLEKTLTISEPVKVAIADGFITEINGGKEAQKLKAHVEKAETKPFKMVKRGELAKKEAEDYAKNARNIGEFGIGLNPKAKIVGNVLEDEKVLGTVHFAVGSNYNQDALALIHSDGIVKDPTVVIDGRPLMKEGKLVL